MPSPIRNEVALLMAQGYSREEAERIAYAEMNQRYAKSEDKRPLPKKNNGEGFGVIEGIKTLLGIEPSEEEQKEIQRRREGKPKYDQTSAQEVEARIGSSIASIMLSGRGSDQLYQKAIGAQNPGAMLGMMAARATVSAREKMKGNGSLTDETIWAAEDGVLDNALGEVFSYAKMYGGVEPDDMMIEQAYKAALTTLAKAGEAEEEAKVNTQRKPSAMQPNVGRMA